MVRNPCARYRARANGSSPESRNQATPQAGRATCRRVRCRQSAGGRSGPDGPQIRPLPPAGQRRHQPVLAVRRTGDEPRQAGRVFGPADSVGHLRRQDSRKVLQVRIDNRTPGQPIRLRKPPPRNRPASFLPRCGLEVQVLRHNVWRGGTDVRRGKVRVLPPRHRNHQ